jgi:type IV pilus assembly protein PilB
VSTLLPDLHHTSASQALHHWIEQAVHCGASDIHFESDASHFRVRFRIDGQLRIMAQQDLHMRDALLSRLKVLARLDIAEKRLPQDGRIQYPLQQAQVDLRVSSLPTLFGEKLVVRILNHSRTRPSLQALGYGDDDAQKLRAALQQPHGMILMTGPTGSGKTLSLYSCLELLNQPHVNISTVEDPCEIQLSGVNQMTLNTRAGLTFASALRALLRQDPDILMVGEIRDLETAEIAIQAAQTGHLVLSTLHTNHAPATLMRLRHMGISPFLVTASVVLIVAQRLVRTLCHACKRPSSKAHTDIFLDTLTSADRQALPAQLLSQACLFESQGCSLCMHGYKGRIGIFQVMPMDEGMQELILEEAPLQSLVVHSQQQGVRTLRQAGYLKALQGVTSLQEVIAHTR